MKNLNLSYLLALLQADMRMAETIGSPASAAACYSAITHFPGNAARFYPILAAEARLR
jgi:hypothetical protein